MKNLITIDNEENYIVDGTTLLQIESLDDILNAANSDDARLCLKIPSHITQISSNVIIKSIDRSNIGKIEKIILPAELTSIDHFAFNRLTGLKEIVFNDKLRMIGQNAFSNCTSLKKISINAVDLIMIDENAFRQCDKLEEVELIDPQSLKYVSDYAFAYCNKLKKVIFRDTEEYMFSLLNYNRRVILGEGVFRNCQKLEHLELPAVAEFQQYCFLGCRSLKEISFDSDSVFRTIPVASFAECNMLQKITIPGTVRYIENYAFENCYELTDIEYTNNNDDDDTSISLGAINTFVRNTLFIDEFAFKNCDKLRNIYISGFDLIKYIDPQCGIQSSANFIIPFEDRVKKSSNTSAYHKTKKVIFNYFVSKE
jgi:hypothetical protein